MKFDKKFWDKLDKDLPGWFSEEEARFLVENVQGNLYVELGVAFGKSYRIVKHNCRVFVLGIDRIEHGVLDKVKEEYDETHKGLWHSNLDGNIIIDDTCSLKIIHKFPYNHFDTLFIDGDHTYEGCFRDFMYWYPKVKPGGKIIFHDYQRDKAHEGVTKAVDAIKPLLKDFKQAKHICCGTK